MPTVAAVTLMVCLTLPISRPPVFLFLRRHVCHWCFLAQVRTVVSVAARADTIYTVHQLRILAFERHGTWCTYWLCLLRSVHRKHGCGQPEKQWSQWSCDSPRQQCRILHLERRPTAFIGCAQTRDRRNEPTVPVLRSAMRVRC